jgi:molybdopterin-guanine dinucleotide biosynthesis adapter protein
MNFTKPVLGICAYGSNAGKTTLLTHLIPLLKRQGVRVSVIKHSHHHFEIDHPGKDSYHLREAGAVQTMLGSGRQWALMTKIPDPESDASDTGLAAMLSQLDVDLADLVLVEGFRQEPISKIEVHRPALGMPLLAQNDPLVIAVATDGPIQCTPPTLDLNDPAAIAGFIVQWLKNKKAHAS